MRYFVFILVLLVLCSSALALDRTVAPVLVVRQPVLLVNTTTSVSPDMLDVSSAEGSLVIDPDDDDLGDGTEVILTKMDVSTSEVLDINKEGSDPDEDLYPEIRADVWEDGYLTSMDDAGIVKEEDKGFVEGGARIIGDPEMDIGKVVNDPGELGDAYDAMYELVNQSHEQKRDAMQDVETASKLKREAAADAVEQKKEEIEEKTEEAKESFISTVFASFVRLFTWSSPEPKEEFMEGVESSDLAMYSGHARYGSGPDDTRLGIKDQNGKDYLEAGFDDIKVDEFHHEEGAVTFWARVKSFFSGEKEGVNELPEVDDEDDIESVIDDADANMDTLSELSQEEALRLQQQMEKKDQAEKTLSNVLNVSEKTQRDIVSNLK